MNIPECLRQLLTEVFCALLKEGFDGTIRQVIENRAPRCKGEKH